MPPEVEGLGGDAAADNGGQTQQPVEQQPQGDSEGGNPSWNEILQVLPTSLHGQVKPALEKWDRGVQQRFEQVQSQYSPYKPFIEQKVSPEDIEVALGIARQINENPQGFYDTYRGWLGIEDQGGQGQQPESNDPEFDLGDYSQGQQQEQVDPRIAQIEQQQEFINNMFMERQQQEMQAQADAELDSQLNSLKETYGEYDMEYVLGLAMAGVPLEDAVKKFQERYGQNRQPDPSLPQVLSPGGGLPAEKVDPKTLDGPNTRSLVEQMLRAAAQKDN